MGRGSRRRRIRVGGLDARLVAVIAAASALGAVTAGLEPTGGKAIDFILVAATTASLVWAAASAPWWAGVAVAAVATALAPEPAILGMGAAAMVGGLAVGMANRAVPWSRALVAGTAVQVLARLGNIGFFGLSSLIGVVLLVTLAFLGLRRRPSDERRIMWIVAGTTAGVAIVAAGVFGAVAMGARSDLSSGNREAREGISLLGSGDIDAAEQSFRQAAHYFARADDAISAPWTLPSRLVPVIAQHRQSTVELVGSGRELSTTIADVLLRIDFDSLTVVEGQMDLAAIAGLEQPLTELMDSLAELETTISELRNPWLVEAINERLDGLQSDIDEQQVRGDNALAAVRQAPNMLGADGPRTYFIAFTTPAEARGVGGFMGNWAELTITDGHIEMTEFGRTADLAVGGNEVKTITGPQELIDNYGGFLLADIETGKAGTGVWSNITTSPDFPEVAQVIAELYPQSGGRQVDGVFVMDVETVARLMELGGPVQLEELGVELSSANAAEFLLTEQYILAGDDSATRIDAIEQVALTTVDRLLGSALPAPPELADLLGPMASQGHLLAWASRPEEQDVYDRLHMTGAMPERDSDGLMITFNNSGGNKIDAYLEAEARYEVKPDLSAGTATATLTIELTNTAPASGMPDYVIGNHVDQPRGTSTTLVSVYSGLQLTSATVDGEPGYFSVHVDSGYLVFSAYSDIPAGATTVIEFQLEGGLDLSDGYSLVVRTPPTARPFPITVEVDGTELGGNPSGLPGVRTYRL